MSDHRKLASRPASTMRMLGAAASVLAVVFLLGVAPATAAPQAATGTSQALQPGDPGFCVQANDPRNALDPVGDPICPPPVTIPPITPFCTFTPLTNVTRGSVVTATVVNAPVGDEVALQLDGQTRVTGTVTAAQAGDTTGSISLSTQIPADLTAGSHRIAAVGPAFTAPCDPTFALGAIGGAKTLAFTGFQLALFLAIALVLLTVGANLVQSARRRRRRQARERHAADVRALREHQLAVMARRGDI